MTSTIARVTGDPVKRELLSCPQLTGRETGENCLRSQASRLCRLIGALITQARLQNGAPYGDLSLRVDQVDPGALEFPAV
jgi:hypothetical protein